MLIHRYSVISIYTCKCILHNIGFCVWERAWGYELVCVFVVNARQTWNNRLSFFLFKVRIEKNRNILICTLHVIKKMLLFLLLPGKSEAKKRKRETISIRRINLCQVSEWRGKNKPRNSFREPKIKIENFFYVRFFICLSHSCAEWDRYLYIFCCCYSC